MQVSATVAVDWQHLGRRRSRDYFGLILVYDHGNGGKDRYWYGIEPAGIYRNEQLPWWDLMGQEWWPSKVWEGQSGLLLEPSEPN